MSEYDRATAKDVIYPGGIRLSDQEHKSLQLQDAHAQAGSVPAETVAILTGAETDVEDESPAKSKKSKK